MRIVTPRQALQYIESHVTCFTIRSLQMRIVTPRQALYRREKKYPTLKKIASAKFKGPNNIRRMHPIP
jgi:hypothetical protein